MGGLSQACILLADDDPNFRKVVAYNLARMGTTVEAVANGREALERLASGQAFDVLLTDVRMPEMDGLELLRALRRREREAAQAPGAPDAPPRRLPVILITAHGDIEMAVQAMHDGADDFLTKPFERDRLAEKIERALRPGRLERENRALREELGRRCSFDGIVGSSPAMRELFDLMGRVAQRDATVLILGESGTGKELVARALHASGPRAAGPFVAVNCAAIPPMLLESELFGHVRGAFTGADQSREGRFQLANGGTLLLDEIGDMPPELQAKILRVLQEREVEPVGAERPVPVDVRIVAATHRDLERLARDGDFRQDLFYRLNVVALCVPPLRDRREDIPLLAKRFLERFGEPDVRLERDALERLSSWSWPGNVRELENAIERALALRADPARITAADLALVEPPRLADAAQAALYEIPDQGIVLDEVERRLIESALAKTGGNQTRAARLLGITRQKLIYRMQKHGLQG
jgi:two-component system NtrC family response regulator